MPSCLSPGLCQTVIFVLGAQDLFIELADAGLGYRLDEDDVIWQVHARKARAQVIQDFFLRQAVLIVRFGHHAGQRTFLPFRMRDGDNGRFQHFRMRHNHVFQLLAGNPFTTAFYQVLGAVNDQDIALRIDGDHIACAEPAF